MVQIIVESASGASPTHYGPGLTTYRVRHRRRRRRTAGRLLLMLVATGMVLTVYTMLFGFG